jgi:DNA-binding phage protein
VDNSGRPTHTISVALCRAALAHMRVRRNDIDRLSSFAQRAGVSLATASRFFNGGHQLRLVTVRRIVQALGLKLENVAVPIEAPQQETS